MVDRKRKRLTTMVEINDKYTLDDIPQHEIAVFSLDHIYLINRQWHFVNGREIYGLHLTAIQDVF